MIFGSKIDTVKLTVGSLFMLKLRASSQRGFADHGWLKAKHTFSFSSYHDEKHMGFRSLRVINEDRVEAEQGFPTHGHHDMEIITYVISGSLEHKDSMGNGSIIKPGELQYMSAGTGVRHSEFNSSAKEDVHLLQIWILPDKPNYNPAYSQVAFSKAVRHNRLKLVATGDEKNANAEGAIRIRQDVDLYASIMDAKIQLDHPFELGRGGWIQLVSGALNVNGMEMVAGDGLMAENESSIRILCKQNAEFLLFDIK